MPSASTLGEDVTLGDGSVQGGDGHIQLLKSSPTKPTWGKARCGRANACTCGQESFQFRDPELETDYNFFFLSERKRLITYVCATVGIFMIVEIAMEFDLLREWESRPALVETGRLSTIFALKLTAAFTLLIVLAALIAAIHMVRARRNWAFLSAFVMAIYVVFVVGSIFVHSCITTQTAATLLLENSSLPSFNAASTLLTAVNEDTVILVVSPMLALIVSAPVKVFIPAVWMLCVIAVANCANVGELASISALPDGLNGSASATSIDVHSVVESVWGLLLQIVIVFTLTSQIVVNLDGVLRAAYFQRWVFELLSLGAVVKLIVFAYGALCTCVHHLDSF